MTNTADERGRQVLCLLPALEIDRSGTLSRFSCVKTKAPSIKRGGNDTFALHRCSR